LFSNPSHSLATVQGTVMGTPSYMSPEQARGESVDQRSDIWAFGTILFEMLAGRKLINEPTPTEALAAVLESDLDFSGLPPSPPQRTGWLIGRCLVRAPKRRLQAIGDVRIILDPPTDAPADGLTELVTPRPGPTKALLAAWVTAAIFVAAFAWASAIAWRAT